MLTAENIQIEIGSSEVEVSAAVRAPIELPDRMWFRLAAGLRDDVAVDADPFLPVLVLAGMAHRLPIGLPEVSTELLHGCRQIMDIFEGWTADGDDTLHRVRIEAPTRPRVRRGRAAGALFSGGVDSTYTVLRNHDRYPVGDARRIQYVVLVHGLDVSLDKEELFSQVLATAREFARTHDVDLISVRTNVRAFTGATSWRYAHGPCMAAVGHLLSPLLHTMFVASSRWIASVRPSGSHPDIDLRWSSERIEFVHHGFEASRSDKVRRIAASDAALRTLRVCWRNPEGTFNCGRCEKCLRTMFALSCFGALERATTFPGRIDPELIARIPLKPGEAPFWVDNLGLAGEPAADPALIEAARRLMENHRFKYSRIGRLEEAVRDAGNRLGLTTGRLKQWDERYFKSTLSDAFRAVKRRVGGQGLR